MGWGPRMNWSVYGIGVISGRMSLHVDRKVSFVPFEELIRPPGYTIRAAPPPSLEQGAWRARECALCQQ
jgi:hypothetical protein